MFIKLCTLCNIYWVSCGHRLHIEGKEKLIDSNSSMRMKLHGTLETFTVPLSSKRQGRQIRIRHEPHWGSGEKPRFSSQSSSQSI